MNYEELIEKRQSIREFKDRIPDEETLTEIKACFGGLDKLMPEIRTELAVCTGDAGVRMEGVVGYRGNAFFAPVYLAILSEKKPHALENVGYMGENLSLVLTDMGLDSCWLTVPDGDAAKRALLIQSDLELMAVIACGYGKAERGVTRVDIVSMANVKFNTRAGHIAPKIAQEELVYEGSWGTAPNWEEDNADPYLDKALYAASLAPSFLNRQTYRYLMAGKELLLLDKKDDMTSSEDSLLNLGATMFNFQAVYGKYNTSGNRWKPGTAQTTPEMHIPEAYAVAASYTLW